MKPKAVYWCDGTQEEYQFMCDLLVQAGSFIKLNPKKRPNRCVGVWHM
jgi:phosphoenolpyruvate carboxykinase (GTP)